MSFSVTHIIGYSAITAILAGVIHLILGVISGLKLRYKLERQLWNVPKVPGHWFWGNALQFGEPDEVLFKNRKFAEEYGPAHLLRFGLFKPLVVLAGDDYIKPVLNTASPKDSLVVLMLKDWIGDGLLMSSGKKWSRNRRLLTPAFHFDILKPYVDVFSDCTKVTIAKWKDLQKQNKSVEVFDSVSLLMLDSLLKCTFGYDSDCQLDGANTPFIKSIYDLSETVFTRAFNPLLHPQLLFYLSSTGRKFYKAAKVVHQYSDNVIKNRRNALKNTKQLDTKDDIFENDNKNSSKKEFIDFLDILLRAQDEQGEGLTDTEIRHEVDTFMFEGHDTTASGLSWFLYNMARHPEYQQKCRDEINNILETNHVSWEDLSKLEYLTMCIKESMRLHSPVPTITRSLTNSVALPNDIVLPADCWVSISLDSLHHSPTLWENPDLYDPSRFAADNTNDRSSHAFLAFSAGPRNCIGQHFAMNEMKTCAALLLRNFEFSVDESVPVVLWFQIILRSKNGIYLKLKPLT